MGGIKLRAASVIFLVAVFLMGVAAVASPLARADGCDVTVTPAGSIQDAVIANPGGVVCLDGTFMGISTVTIGTSITLTTDTVATIAGGDGPAFRLADGVSDVKIEELEIKDRTGSRGGGIEAWDVTTSRIKVENNYLHDNSYNGILVGSEGGFIHEDWKVENNRVDDNGFAGIELTNCKDCVIEGNTLDGNLLGIVVQARSTSTTGVGSFDVDISDVEVGDNTVSGGLFGIYVLSFTGHPTDFTPITGASSLLTGVEVKDNIVTDATVAGIIFWAFNDDASAMGEVKENTVNCATSSGDFSILVLEAGSGQSGTVSIELDGNTIDLDCAVPFADPGTTDD